MKAIILIVIIIMINVGVHCDTPFETFIKGLELQIPTSNSNETPTSNETIFSRRKKINKLLKNFEKELRESQ